MDQLIDPPEGEIAIVVLTHNRVHLLEKCVENVLLPHLGRDARDRDLGQRVDRRHRGLPQDDRRPAHPRRSAATTNIGQNGYARAFRETTSPYLIELDDDVIDAPAEWDAMLRDAFVKLPDVGFLAADLEDDPNDEASRFRHHVRPHEYTLVEENGVRLLARAGRRRLRHHLARAQPAGRRLPENTNEVFWLEDAAYIEDIQRLGLHAPPCSPTCGCTTPAARTTRPRRRRRRSTGATTGRARRAASAVKRVLVRVPVVRRLNARFGWFVAPS